MVQIYFVWVVFLHRLFEQKVWKSYQMLCSLWNKLKRNKTKTEREKDKYQIIKILVDILYCSREYDLRGYKYSTQLEKQVFLFRNNTTGNVDKYCCLPSPVKICLSISSSLRNTYSWFLWHFLLVVRHWQWLVNSGHIHNPPTAVLNKGHSERVSSENDLFVHFGGIFSVCDPQNRHIW